MNKKDFLRHELLNLFTILSFYVEDDYFNQKQAISELLKKATLLIKYEKIILGKKIDFFKKEVSLFEVFEILNSIYSAQTTSGKIKLKMPSRDFFCQTDQSYLLEGLDFLLSRLIQTSTQIEVFFNQKEKKILIDFVGPSLELINEDIIDYLKTEQRNFSEIAFCFALNLFKQLGIEVKVLPSQIQIINLA